VRGSRWWHNVSPPPHSRWYKNNLPRDPGPLPLLLPFPHLEEWVTPIPSVMLFYLIPSMCSAWILPFGEQNPRSSDHRLHQRHSGCTDLHCHQQCIMVPGLLHHHQHLLLLLPLNMAILSGMRWNLSVVLIHISFITRAVEHFFMYLQVICTSSFENSLFNSCAYFFIGILINWGLNLLSSL
jgi:hypothetical protein